MKGRSEEDEARGYVVWGRVQGVGFRWWTRRTASALGLAGHVRNLANGAVEVQARGNGEALDALEKALLEGPSMARVDRLERVATDPRTPVSGFQMEVW